MTRSNSFLTILSEARADFLREAALAGVRPVVVIPEGGSVNAPLAEFVAGIAAEEFLEMRGADVISHVQEGTGLVVDAGTRNGFRSAE